MSDRNEYKPFNNTNQPDEDQLFIEVQDRPRIQHPKKQPSGFEPMESIYLRGQAYRNLASGNTPWWIIIASWLIFGLPSLIIALIVLPDVASSFQQLFFSEAGQASFWENVLGLVSSTFPLIVAIALFYMVWRGTRAKFRARRRRR